LGLSHSIFKPATGGKVVPKQDRSCLGNDPGAGTVPQDGTRTVKQSRVREMVSRESHKLQLAVQLRHPQPTAVRWQSGPMQGTANP